MGMTEKQSLINQLTIKFVEDYNLNLKEVKGKVQDILQQYHITIADEFGDVGNQDTEYLMKKFADGKIASGMNEKTIRQYKIAVALVEDYTKKRLSDIESDDITQFLKEYGKTVSSVTLRSKYQFLSSVFNYLFTHRFILHNPITYVDVPKMTVKYKTPMSDCDLEKMKVVCESLPKKESLRDMALLYFFVSTGCRVSEVAHLKVGDVNFEDNTCTVMGKGKKQRPVVLTDKAVYRLNRYLESRKYDLDSPLFSSVRKENTFIGKDGIELIIKRIKNKAEIDNVTCHSLRRYFATELRKRNVNIQIIASSLGHSNLNQINRYSLYNQNEILEKVRSAM